MIVSIIEKLWWECIKTTGVCTAWTGDNSTTGWTDKCNPGEEWTYYIVYGAVWWITVVV